MRFAAYGRVSTEDQQDPYASRNWRTQQQRVSKDQIRDLVERLGDIRQVLANADTDRKAEERDP
jgi:site-specific DNA recombinase